MGFYGAAESKVEHLTGNTINIALVIIALALLGVVLLVQNKWLKAAILAWIVLP